MRFRSVIVVRFLLSPVFVLSQCQFLQAQTATGMIAGVVTDASGDVVPDAEVKATNEATEQEWTAASDLSGEFQLKNLPPGFYTLQVSTPGFHVFHANKICVANGSSYSVPVELTVESARRVIVVNGGPADEYKPATATSGNLGDRPLLELPLSVLVVTRSVLDDQQSRLLSEVAKNDASVGEDYAPVGWYQDFMIRGFTLDLASGFKINGLASAGEQIVALENKDSVEFLHGVDADEVGVGSGGGLVNYVTKRPVSGVRTLNLSTDQRGTFLAESISRAFGVRDSNLACA